MHHTAGVVLEQLYESDPRPHLAELAYHFAHGLAGDRGKAIDYSIRAGKRALAQLAYEAAVEQFRCALELVASAPEASERLAALLDLAEAHRRAGDTDAAREMFEAAAEAARHRGDGAGLAHAALGYGALWGEWVTEANRRILLLLDEALDALDPTDSRLRARVLARLARVHYFGKDTAAADRLSLAAVQMARRLPDAGTLAETLAARQDALWVPGDPTPRLGIAAELLVAARDCGDDELALQTHAVRFTALLERGDAVAADSELEAYERLAETLKQPRYRWYAMSRRAVRAIMAGRFAEGEQLALEALALGQRAQEPEAEPMFFDARRTLGRHRGFDDHDLAAHVGYASRYPNQPIFRAAAAHIAAELGRAQTEWELARVLLRRGEPGDAHRARDLLAAAGVRRDCQRCRR